MQASNTIEPVCNTFSSLSNVINLLFFTNLTTFLFVTITPLGLPVDPEVYIIYAKLSTSYFILTLELSYCSK